MNLEILKKANFPKSYSTQDEAFDYGTGDNFFQLPNGTFICLSENDELFEEFQNHGFKTLLQIYLENIK